MRISRLGATWNNIRWFLKRRVYLYQGHWLWVRSCIREGYGQLTIEGVPWLAHRASYVAFVGPIPDDKPFVLHTCDIKKCINPEHLWVGTHQDNMDDKVRKQRQFVKIPVDVVEQIRNRVQAGESQADVSRDLLVSSGQVCKIVNAKQRMVV